MWCATLGPLGYWQVLSPRAFGERAHNRYGAAETMFAVSVVEDEALEVTHAVENQSIELAPSKARFERSTPRLLRAGQGGLQSACSSNGRLTDSAKLVGIRRD